MNPIQDYRRAQREARRLFEPFTSAHCPTCATPCCRKPTWVRPTDVVLVEELGYTLPQPERKAASRLLEIATGDAPSDEGAPCDYLAAEGCTFPDDLRPFGCAALICEPMRREMPREELVVVERAVERLQQSYERLIAGVFELLPEQEKP